MDAKLAAAYEKLKAIREREDLALKPTPLLKQTYTDFDGNERPFRHRYYQVQAILHMVAMNRFLLGDDTGLGKCVTGDTLVKTNKGLIPIQDLNPGVSEPDTAVPFEDETVKVEFGGHRCRIKNFYYGGEKPTIKIRTHHGYEVEGSQIHPVMVRRGGVDQWVRLRDIQEGDFIAVERDAMTAAKLETHAEPDLPSPGVEHSHERRHRIPSKMSPELGRFLGYLVSEGWFNRHDFFTLSQHADKNPEVYADMKKLVRDLFDYETRPTDEGFQICSTQIIRFLEGVGVAKGLSKDREVPWAVLQGSPHSVKEFIRGYVDAEGYVSQNGIEVSSASEKLLSQIQVLLLGFGITSRRTPKQVKGRDHTYWRLTVLGDDARSFMRQIGLVSRRKEASIAPLLEKQKNPNYDVVPEAKAEVEDLRAEVYARSKHHGYAISNQWGSAFYNTLQHIRTGRRNPTYQYLKRLLEVAQEVGVSERNPAVTAVQHLVDRKWFFDPVESVQDGWAEVFDIEVDDPRHAFVSNGIISHNTLMCISALCYVWAKEPDTKAIILTNKSVVGQWALEFEKFCAPDSIKTIICAGTPAKRQKAYKEFEHATGPTVLIMGYASARRDIPHIQGWEGFILCADEATAFKNPSTQTYQVVRHLANQSSKFWALTATLIKNNLMEGYGIYSALVPGLFPSSKNKFIQEYCLTRLQAIPGSRRQIPVVIGYRKGAVDKFRDRIDPYFLARAKFDVAKELPVLTIQERKCGMTRVQDATYQEALAGLFERQSGEEVETTKLTALIYCQQIVDHPELVDVEGESDKMRELFELLTEGDYANEKIIVFSRFKKMIDKLERVAHSKKYKLKTVRITGDEDEQQRKDNMVRFQNPDDDVRICWITEAAKEGINLQAAKALVFYDSPWSAGDYIQILGRMIRIGSKHDRCYAIHMVAKNTIDSRVMGVLKKKMKLVEQVMGKRIKGEGMEDIEVTADNSIDDIFAALKNDAKRYV